MFLLLIIDAESINFFNQTYFIYIEILGSIMSILWMLNKVTINKELVPSLYFGYQVRVSLNLSYAPLARWSGS